MVYGFMVNGRMKGRFHIYRGEDLQQESEIDVPVEARGYAWMTMRIRNSFTQGAAQLRRLAPFAALPFTGSARNFLCFFRLCFVHGKKLLLVHVYGQRITGTLPRGFITGAIMPMRSNCLRQLIHRNPKMARDVYWRVRKPARIGKNHRRRCRFWVKAGELNPYDRHISEYMGRKAAQRKISDRLGALMRYIPDVREANNLEVYFAELFFTTVAGIQSKAQPSFRRKTRCVDDLAQSDRYGRSRCRPKILGRRSTVR